MDFFLGKKIISGRWKMNLAQVRATVDSSSYIFFAQQPTKETGVKRMHSY